MGFYNEAISDPMQHFFTYHYKAEAQMVTRTVQGHITSNRFAVI